MMPFNPVTAVADAIHLAVAPVFLLTGLGAMLGVLSARLARIIDRSRKLHELLSDATGTDRQRMHHELTLLSRRARLINWAISLCVACALLISTVIAVLFLDSFTALNMSLVIAVLFVAAMVAFILGLLGFLREVYLATANLRIGPN
ncbi:MAG: DUF2721 domain-containing protein [Gammaproteobacteria bacterium]|jgi:MFS family permease